MTTNVKNDRELLELAAKAAGLAWEWNSCAHCGIQHIPSGLSHYVDWRPLSDDGDALRLAANLKIDINFLEGFQEVQASTYDFDFEAYVSYTDDRAKDVRLAVVMVAAAIGESMP